VASGDAHVPLAVRGDGPHVAGRVVPARASYAGEAVSPVAVPPTWRAELQERFAPVNPPLFVNIPDASGPANSWVIQFRLRTIIF
jgi:hypothetical protein